jgi:hypothetical protein
LQAVIPSCLILRTWRSHPGGAPGRALGFEKAGLERIIGLVHPANIGSIRVLEKCGLKPIDRKMFWGLELERYRIGRQGFQELESTRQP